MACVLARRPAISSPRLKSRSGPMKTLLAVDGSAYTKRMLGFIAAHDEWLGAKHHYTVIHCVAPLPHRAAAFEGLELVQRYYDDDAEVVLRPIREFFRMQDQ